MERSEIGGRYHRPVDVRAIEALIPTDVPTRPRALAVLDGVLAGRISTDDPAHPGWALIIETADGTVFCGGDPSADAIREALARSPAT